MNDRILELAAGRQDFAKATLQFRIVGPGFQGRLKIDKPRRSNRNLLRRCPDRRERRCFGLEFDYLSVMAYGLFKLAVGQPGPDQGYSERRHRWVKRSAPCGTG